MIEDMKAIASRTRLMKKASFSILMKIYLKKMTNKVHNEYTIIEL